MSSSHQSTITSLEQAKKNYRKVVDKYLMYFQITQIVSGKGPKTWKQELLVMLYISTTAFRYRGIGQLGLLHENYYMLTPLV